MEMFKKENYYMYVDSKDTIQSLMTKLTGNVLFFVKS